MFTSPTIEQIEKMLLPLRDNTYLGKSDYQKLLNKSSAYRGLAALFALQFMNSMPFQGSGWRIAIDIFQLSAIIYFWWIGTKYRLACKVMEEACPISFDEIKKNQM